MRKARKKRNKKKSDCQMIHLKKRWLERIGTDISRSTHNSIVDSIRRGETKIVKKTSNRVSVHETIHLGKAICVVYDRERKQLVTVYAKEEK